MPGMCEQESSSASILPRAARWSTGGHCATLGVSTADTDAVPALAAGDVVAAICSSIYKAELQLWQVSRSRLNLLYSRRVGSCRKSLWLHRTRRSASLLSPQGHYLQLSALSGFDGVRLRLLLSAWVHSVEDVRLDRTPHATRTLNSKRLHPIASGLCCRSSGGMPPADGCWCLFFKHYC